MSRYKIATKTDVLRNRIAKEVFGEIEDSDGVRDVPSWEIFEKCLEQHKKINELQDQLALTEKALELACDDIWAMSIWENTKEEVIADSVEFYKQKAKEMMKSE